MRKAEVYLNDLPKRNKGGAINWNKSIGLKFNCSLNGRIFELKIKNKNGSKLILEFENEEYEIDRCNLLKGQLMKIIGNYNSNNYERGNTNRNNIARKKFHESTKESDLTFLGEYINNYTKIKSMCKEGHIVEHLPKYYIDNVGVCEKCKSEKIKLEKINKKIKKESKTLRDGFSYPEKFMMEFLNQLNLYYEREKTFEWSCRKKYDFYCEDLNMIIETHGEQHYGKIFSCNKKRGYGFEFENDKFKKDIAIKNGIKNYIVIDSRKSELDWIKNSILNVEEFKIFNLDNINWKLCSKKGSSSMIYEICGMYILGEKIKNISEVMKITKGTVIKYLKLGDGQGVIHYVCDKTESKHVGVYKDDKLIEKFESISDCCRNFVGEKGRNPKPSCVSNVCNNKSRTHLGLVFKFI